MCEIDIQYILVYAMRGKIKVGIALWHKNHSMIF